MCTRKFDELKTVSARSRARLDEPPRDPQLRELAPQPRERQGEPDDGRHERERAEQDEPAPARQQQDDEQCVEDGREEVGEVLDVPALARDEQVVEETEREAQRRAR